MGWFTPWGEAGGRGPFRSAGGGRPYLADAGVWTRPGRLVAFSKRGGQNIAARAAGWESDLDPAWPGGNVVDRLFVHPPYRPA